MIKWASLILLCIGILLVFLSILFGGFMLKWQLDNQFDREQEIRALINSEDFKKGNLEQKTVYLALEEAEFDRVGYSLQIWQNIFFLGLGAGALILSSGLAMFFFWQNRRFNEQLHLLAMKSAAIKVK